MDKDKKAFLERLKDRVYNTFVPDDQTREYSDCIEYAAEDFERYVGESMPSANIDKFETHCMSCIGCAVRLIQARAKLVSKKEEEEQSFLLAKTYELLDVLLQAEDKPAEADSTGITDWVNNKIFVILDKIKGTWRLVKTTGEILTPAPAMATRKRDHSNGSNDIPVSIQVVQDFIAPSISIQVTISEHTSDSLMLSVSLFNKDTDEFISKAELQLRRDQEVLCKARSNFDGSANLIIQAPIDYEVDVLIDGIKIGTIKVICTE